jgi:hypothetical protein
MKIRTENSALGDLFLLTESADFKPQNPPLLPFLTRLVSTGRRRSISALTPAYDF